MTVSNKELLRQHGIKYSQQRDIVLNLLRHLTRPASVEELYTKALPLHPTIHLSTVYRILENFEAHHLVVRNTLSEDKKNVYELYTPAHKHYMVCLKCHQCFPIPDCPCNILDEAVTKATDFEVIDHKIEILGYCATCQLRH
ncbi:transcriptional repressor [Sporanaerobium hydrogeniformans]|uniref:Transcriptional repressor n=1 Tax=Sporanaerobium hydrogeniformans TaxID=3072179 RepID=A0AC61DDS4_9FIRM|nr:Fur family transcriptional regulator [Sporanaerobium hydrogeniformans]PHV71419.1 transcriptional repressor [Sporanaerobium hydrogeniformans]